RRSSRDVRCGVPHVSRFLPDTESMGFLVFMWGLVFVWGRASRPSGRSEAPQPLPPHRGKFLCGTVAHGRRKITPAECREHSPALQGWVVWKIAEPVP